MWFADWLLWRFLLLVRLWYEFVPFTRIFNVGEEIFFEVGARIASVRGAMKQSDFAEKLGVNRQTVSRWEAGERLPDGSSLLRMREAFGADINVLLDGKAGGVAPDLRPDENQLLEHYRAAHADARERIRQVAATAANSPKRGAKLATGDEVEPGQQGLMQRVRGDGNVVMGSNTGDINMGSRSFKKGSKP